jgi:hypothetical protein
MQQTGLDQKIKAVAALGCHRFFMQLQENGFPRVFNILCRVCGKSEANE